MEKEKVPQFTIAEMTIDMMDEVTDMRLESWLDTYVNEEVGVTREWLEARNQEQKAPKLQRLRRERFTSGKAHGTYNAWVALDGEGRVIGAATPFIDEDGRQHVGSLYVDKKWHGTGAAAQLMQKILEWFDSAKSVELGVVTYNERAKAFYRKWGFAEVPGSETLFVDKIPEIMMVKKGE